MPQPQDIVGRIRGLFRDNDGLPFSPCKAGFIFWGEKRGNWGSSNCRIIPISMLILAIDGLVYPLCTHHSTEWGDPPSTVSMKIPMKSWSQETLSATFLEFCLVLSELSSGQTTYQVS